MRKFIFIVFIFLTGSTIAQNRAIDSLAKLLKATTEISKKIEIQCQLSQRFTEIGEFEKGGALANEALTIATDANDEKGIGLSYYSLSRLNQYIGDWNKALSYHYRAFPIFDALEAHEELAWTYLNMAISFRAQKDIKRSLRYARKALEIFTKIEFQQGIAYSYLNLSLALNDDGNFDEAIVFMNKAKSLCIEIGDQRGVGYVLNSMAAIYQNLGEYDKAIAGNLECIKIREKENDKMDLAFCYANLGEIFFLKRQYFTAERKLVKGENLAKQVNSRSSLRSIYLTWSKVDSANGNYVKAYDNFKKYAYYDQLLSNEESQKKASELQYTYENERKEKEIDLIKKEQAIQHRINAQDRQDMRLVLIAVCAGLVLVLIFSVSLYKRGNQMKKQRNIIGQQKARVDEQHQSIKDSIIYARKIQQALMTSEEYILEHLKRDFFVFYQAKDIVSGDFYWASEHNGDFYMVTADCTGHGVPGAFMSLLNISIMNELIVERNTASPAKVLDEQKKQIIKALSTQSGEDSNDGMDCVLCRFNADRTEVTFAAANSSLWLLRNNEIQKFKGDKMPVGKFLNSDKKFTEHTISLEKGDIIYTFTDGIIDQFGGENDKKFKQNRLVDLLLKVQHLPMNEQYLAVMTALEQWMGNSEQTDDMLMIGVKC